MNLFDKLYILQHLIHWRLTWNKRDTNYQWHVPENPKFMSAMQAVSKIPDGSVIATSGLAGNQRPSILYWAIRELFEKSGHPHDLTIICTGGQGGRGKVPGTMEELGQKGLCSRFIAGHLETFRSLLSLAESGNLEMHCLPQGIITMLLEEQSRGNNFLLSRTGKGTFVDPKSGRGSVLAAPPHSNPPTLVSWEGENLRYQLPSIQVAMFNAPAADREGNIYVKNCAMIAESYEIAKAAKKNGGIVIANVGLVVEKGYDDIFLPTSDIDAIVAYPRTEQTGAVYHRKHWPLFTTQNDANNCAQKGSEKRCSEKRDEERKKGIEIVRFINQVLGITPRRNKISEVMARAAASLFAKHVGHGNMVNIGIGLPEEVCRLICKHGLADEITFFTEAGVLGGVPAPGVFFGASVCPNQIISSARIFKRCYENLDIAILGILQVDSMGNVNVSKRGEKIGRYVGPGGFIDMTSTSKTIIFIGSWMNQAKIKVDKEKLRIVQMGKPKFVDRVDEITFYGPQAIESGRKVFYVTDVACFKLTSKGMELMSIMPGVDLQKHILEFSSMKIVLPESGQVPVIDSSIITGKGFSLSFSR